jgi:uncharacterized protein (TIGR02996 family)
MTDADALLAAIAAHPDEDTPRLVYADWLEEHDRPIRAEFIRLQCEIARKETLPRAILNRYVDLFKRNQELIDSHRAELLGPLASLPNDTKIEFRRGFVSEIELPVGHFLTHAATIALLKPLPRVGAKSVSSRLSDFVNCPHLECISRISAYSAEFASFPGVIWPQEDALREAIGRLTHLEVLDLEGCGLSNQRSVLDFDFSLPALIDLNLSLNEIGDAGVARLLRTNLPRQLKRLVLGGNPIDDEGAIELAGRWPVENELEHLNMKFTNIGPVGQQVLLERFGGKVDLF